MAGYGLGRWKLIRRRNVENTILRHGIEPNLRRMIKLHDAQSYGDSSTRSEGAGVFTRPGPGADIDASGLVRRPARPGRWCGPRAPNCQRPINPGSRENRTHPPRRHPLAPGKHRAGKLRCEPSLDVGRCVPDNFVYEARLGKHRHMA